MIKSVLYHSQSLIHNLIARSLIFAPLFLLAIPTLEGSRGFGALSATVSSLFIIVASYFLFAVFVWLALRLVSNIRLIHVVCALSLAFSVVLFVDNSFQLVDKALGATQFYTDATMYGKAALGLATVALAAVVLGAALWPILAMASSAILVFALASVAITLAKPSYSPEFVDFEKPPFVLAANTEDERRTRVIIILDGLLGKGGVDRSLEGGAEYVKAIDALSAEHGLVVVPDAISAYPATRSSIPAALNGLWDKSPADVSAAFSEIDGGTSTLTANRLFDHVLSQDHGVQVYQTPYINYCGHAAVYVCKTLNIFDGNNDWIAPQYRVGFFGMGFVTLRKIYANTAVMKYLLSAAHRAAEKVGSWLGNGSVFIPKDAAFGSLSMPKLLEQVADAALAAKPGTLLFVHVLAPHYPYLLNKRCERAAQWYPFPRQITEIQGLHGQRLNKSREEHYVSYFSQAICVVDQLNKLMKSMDKNGQNIDVVFMSDHGSRISAGATSNFIGSRDLIDNYSAFFAYRTQNAEVEPSKTLVQHLIMAAQGIKITSSARRAIQQYVWVPATDGTGFVQMTVKFPIHN